MFVLISVFVLAVVIFAYIRLVSSQTKFDKDYDNIKDYTLCPETTVYFANYQSRASSWHLAMIGTGIVMIYVLIIFAILIFVGKSCVRVDVCILALLLTKVVVFCVMYKMLNCVKARMCFVGGCSKKPSASS